MPLKDVQDYIFNNFKIYKSFKKNLLRRVIKPFRCGQKE